MTEPNEDQPALAEQKRPARRKPSPRGKSRAPKADGAATGEMIAQDGAEPVAAAAPEAAPAAAEAAPVATPAPAPAPMARPDDDQIEDAAQILSRITSAPLSPSEALRGTEQQQRYTPRGQHRSERYERPERSERYNRGDRPDRSPDQGYDEPPAGPPGAEGPGGSSGGEDESGPKQEPIFADGIVEVSGKGFGFLRDPKRNFVQSPTDVFVTPEVVRRFALRDGHWIKGEVRRGSRGLQMFRLTSINGDEPTDYGNFPLFEELTVISPTERFRLETVPDRYTTRIMDLMCPIGKGQRGLIVAPPRTGKTTLLQHIADAIVKNHPETVLIILLVDERPEEVTEIRRTVPTAEMMASSNDMDLKSHTRIAQLAIERAKRLVEAGKDVFVLLDSITRVGRAFNNAMGGGGRTMSGGIDARALEIPRKLFASARNTEEAGSLTIVATALIDTGSRMDELIFQEFKGTGNMEMVLDRKISDLRVYPAIDIFKSGTRREELLVPADQLHKINVIRRGLAGHKPEEAIERLLSFVRRFPTNYQMLKEIPG